MKKMYKAQGFVEALIAILITGIAAVGLMTVAATTIGDVIQNEILDQVNQQGVKGNLMLQTVVEEWNFDNRDPFEASGNLIFPPTDVKKDAGLCFHLDGDPNSYDTVTLTTSEAIPNCTMDIDGIVPASCVAAAQLAPTTEDDDEDSDFTDQLFRIACLDSDTDYVRSVLVTRIYTGSLGCESITDRVRNIENDKNAGCKLSEYVSVHFLKYVGS